MSRSLACLVTLWVISGSAVRAETFNTHFIRGNYSQLPAALDTTSEDGQFYPGDYLLDIYFNKEKTGRERITVLPGQEGGLCYSKAFLAKHSILLRQELFAAHYVQAQDCFRVQDHPDATVELDHSQQALRFKVPQSLIANRGNALMAQWDTGTHGANLQYSYRGTRSERNGLTQFGEVDGNLNLGRWVFSGRAYKYNDEDIVTPEYRLATAIAAVRGEAAIGKQPLQASLIPGFAFKGVSLVSDNQMTPWLSQSYAPVISGIARTEAVITVRQQGYIIYSRTVPPGPYAIRNLAGVASGDLEVTVREDDGSESVEIYPVSILPSLLRPGHLNYSLAAGRKDTRDRSPVDYTGKFVLAAADYGLEAFTLNTSLLFDPHYRNLAGGMTRSFGPWGAVSASGNLSSAEQVGDDDLRGYSVSFKYAKNLQKDTTLQIAGYRYASRDYIDYVDFYPGMPGGTGIKNRLEAFMTHRDGRTLYSGSIWRQNDWKGENAVGASLRMTRPFGVVNVTSSLNYGVQESPYRHANKSFSAGLSFSLPLSYFERRTYSSTSLSASRGGDVTANSTLSGALAERTRYSLNAGTTQGKVNSYASLTQGFDAATTSLSVSDSAGQRALTASISGSVVQAGDSPLVFTQLRNNTVAVVQTAGLTDARFGRLQADHNGNAVVRLTPYNRNTVKIDATALPHDIELDSTAHNLVPTRRSVHQIQFAHRRISRYILKVWLDSTHQTLAPFNAVALTPEGEQLGFVTEGGILLFSSDAALPSLTLSLPQGNTCQLPTQELLANAQRVQEVICE